jgi:hypothetical protein
MGGTGFVVSDVFGAWIYYLGCLLGMGFIPPPKRRSSISFSKLVLFLLASKVCF